MLQGNVPGANPVVAVDSAELFVGPDSLVSYVPPAMDDFYEITVDSCRTDSPDSLYLSSQPSGNLLANGFVCGQVELLRYSCSNGVLYENGDTLVSNIDSLRVEIRDSTMALVGSDHWENRVFFTVMVAGHNGKTGRLRENFVLSDTLRFQN
jgi:hypothetical protein